MAGRPSKFDSTKCEQAEKLAKLGARDKEIAEFFDVAESTINNWKLEYPDFAESLKRGKMIADAEVSEKLFHRAIGYSHPEDKIFLHEGNPVIVPTTKHYPPDSTACIFWLKNRQKDKWRDRHDHEHTGKDGGPIETESVSDTELARRIAFVLETAGREEAKH